MNILDELIERGIIHSVAYEEETKKLLEKPTKFYMGFDPTGPSLTLGHFVAMLMIARMQKAGHKPYILMGGATALIGDPSFRNSMRPMMTREQVRANIESQKKQFACVIDFEGPNKAEIVNNADWLEKLTYVDFIREVGSTLSVNKMLSCECFKQRMEQGLSFLEFNYMPMQAYDFFHLFTEKDCVLEIGGSDQWANILAGVDLIRRKCEKEAYAFCNNLLLTSNGKKMGKTEKGAIFLSAEKTTPYEMYQYLRNVNDADVKNSLKLLTLLDLNIIKDLCKEGGEKLNKAKEVLAFEVVKLVHGEKEATLAQEKARSAFSGGENIEESQYKAKIGESVADVLVGTKISSSKGEAKRLIESGAVRLNGEKVQNIQKVIEKADLKNAYIILQKGKKVFVKVLVIKE